MSRLLRFFIRLSGGMAALIALASILAGACNTAMLAVLNRALEDEGSENLLALAFVAAVTLKLVTSYVSDVMLIRFSARTLAQLRDRLALQVTEAPLRRVERLGPARIVSLLTGDIETLNVTYLALPYYGSQAAILVGGALYLGWLSPPTLLALSVFSVISLVGQNFAFRATFRWLERARHFEEQLLGHFEGLTAGLKQLKLNRARRRAFLQDDLARTSRLGLEHGVAAGVRFSAADHMTQLSLYMLLGLLMFLLPGLVPVERAALTGYVLTIVFLMGPLRALLGAHGKLVSAGVAVGRIEELAEEIQGLAEASDLRDVPSGPAEAAPVFTSIELSGIGLRYDAEGSFSLGPVDACLRPGETIYVTGGNGSGKTTLVKVLCGLYEPDEGHVVWNGTVVTDQNRDEFRQLFSAVFADHHLFDRPLGGLAGVAAGATGAAVVAGLGELERLLARFRIEHRVQLVGGRFPDLELSRGQRARLALVMALLEDRPIYVFDEWAAEQDPTFRRRFYEEFVLELKARGKTVIVITHDDRFFHLADRRWHVAEGKCEELDPSGHTEREVSDLTA